MQLLDTPIRNILADTTAFVKNSADTHTPRTKYKRSKIVINVAAIALSLGEACDALGRTVVFTCCAVPTRESS